MYKSITISGAVATGTSTAAKNVAKKLKLKYISAGDFFRKFALENNFPLHDKSRVPDKLDQDMDKKLTDLVKSGGYIIDSHYAGYFNKNNKNVLKILLVCDDDIRFKRALKRRHTHDETVEEIKLREKGIRERFNKLYSNDNFEDPKIFDLVIDTTSTKEDEVTSRIVNKFNS